MKNPKAFISYAREGEPHNSWVRALAEKLVHQGVDVRLDQWGLQPGGDVAHFMEEGVRQADYVLAICTPTYAAKFDSRTSGVGQEGDLVRGDLLTTSRLDGRVIPVLKHGPPSSAIPFSLLTKLYVDFTGSESFDDSLEQLVRRLHNAPKHVAPTLGSPRYFDPQEPRPAPAPSAMAWLLVAGIGARRRDLSEAEFPLKLRLTAEELGRMLASDGYGLVTGGWRGVDEMVARSFTRALPAGSAPLEDRLVQVIAESSTPAYPAGHLILVKEGKQEWTESVRRADAIVMVGGVGGTKTTGRFAREFGKAIFPLADTGGDAKEFYLDMIRDYPSHAMKGIDVKQFRIVAREAPGVVGDLRSLLKSIVWPTTHVR